MTRTLKLWAEMLRLSWRREPWLVAGAVGCLVVRVGGVAASAFALRAAVDEAAQGIVASAVIAALAAAVAYALLILMQDLTDSLTMTIADRVGRLDIHPRIHRDLAGIEGIDHLERTEFLDRVSLVRKAGGYLASGAWKALTTVSGGLNLVVTMLLLGGISPWLLLLLVFAAVPIWCDNRGQIAIQRADLATAEQYRLQQHLFELGCDPGAGKELRVSGAGRTIIGLQADAWRAAMRGRLTASMVAALWSFLGWVVFVGAFVAGIVLAARQASRGQGTPGDLVLVVTVAVTLRSSIQSTVETTTAMGSARQYVGPYLWLRDYADRARAGEKGEITPPSTLASGIALENVTYTYAGTDRKAIDNISVTLPAGSVVAIVGEYGSGKTTLVKLLEKFYQPDSGRITVDSVPIGEIDTVAWRARTTAAFQDFGRFHTTVGENIGLGHLPALQDEYAVRAAMTDADAADFVDRLPDGLATLLGRQLGGTDLSEGQWQRIALARSSMRHDPLLMILDEPTASLDALSEHAIFDRYMARARALAARTGAVTVIVSHRFSTVTGADLILVLDNGRLVEEGAHADLMRIGGIYAQLYGLQAAAYQQAER
ncbi:MAG TPA: ABC transporter ATP-binding protein [Actinoplanes sp.]|nr:ABC transporter ATP-binding protein [Actinoplanes sp.]